jgi:hypothetical protein
MLTHDSEDIGRAQMKFGFRSKALSLQVPISISSLRPPALVA